MFYPADKRIIKPIVTAFLESIGQKELISTYGLESFETQCINPRKTICDKVSRLVKLSYNEDAAALLAKHIRDVYDLSALYHNQEYNDYLHSEDFLDAMYRVTIEDGLNKTPVRTCRWLMHRYSRMPKRSWHCPKWLRHTLPI